MSDTPERAIAHPLPDKLLTAVGHPTSVKGRSGSTPRSQGVQSTGSGHHREASSLVMDKAERPLPVPESTREGHRPRRKLTSEALTKIGTSLTEIDWRLLHWLLCYPLQRADDLGVGVARWASRATVYRRVQRLEARELVERVLPKTPGTGKRLYHLSNLGLHLLASHLERPARELAHAWQADEAGLLRRLSRLPTLLLLQEVVNGLVTYAAEAMTTQGRRPQLVRWTWQRELTHRFRYREQAMCLFADGTGRSVRSHPPGRW